MSEMLKYFLSLSDECPEIIIEASYASESNFTGRIVPGYKCKKALLAIYPSLALKKVQMEALSKGLSLKIFDGYRPVKAVSFFQSWAQLPEDNLDIKNKFYPGFSRLELFEQGFIARQSSHSRGSAVDLTLVDRISGRDLDMGTEFDYFHESSNTLSKSITQEQLQNRLLLKGLMENHGFKNYPGEWWHYSFKPEPHPKQYFDFDIE